MITQLSLLDEIEAGKKLHDRENNPESQSFLEENRDRLSKQCEKVHELLKSGVVLTTENAISFGIRSLPRRILDLKRENGIVIPSRWIAGANGKRGFKEWYL